MKNKNLVRIFAIGFGLIWSLPLLSYLILQQTTFMPNNIASLYYSTPNFISYKPLNDPDQFLLFSYFNPTNTTEIKGIVHVVKVDNVSYENSFRAYCLNANTNKYWIQDCITYMPYSNNLSNAQNYELQTEVWIGQKPLLNTEEIIPNASIYKNQTFYLNLVVKNNIYVASESNNNGKTEYIKVGLPKNQTFGAISNGSSMNTEIHEESFRSLNTGLLGPYALNSTIQSLSGNFTRSNGVIILDNHHYLIFDANNTGSDSCTTIPLNSSYVRDICFEHKQ